MTIVMDTIAATKMVSPENLSGARNLHTLHYFIFINIEDLIEEIHDMTVEIKLQYGNGISAYQTTKGNKYLSVYKKNMQCLLDPRKDWTVMLLSTLSRPFS